MTDSDRDLDFVLWGATGFVGRLAAEYLAEYYGGEDVRWALGGRNRDKLRELRDDLGHEFGLSGEVPILVGDALDRETLDPIAARTDVVCTTVGPYGRYGTDLVAACVEHGTDYCDLTGEVTWIRKMIGRFHEEARRSGARIVHCCGFDSIPSDLGTLMVQTEALETLGRPCEHVSFYLLGGSGGFSGGTLASMVDTFEEATRDGEARAVLADPYSLNPPDRREGPDSGSQQSARFDETIDAWTAPFVMATINEKIVRRSNALLEDRYGRDFRYGESIRTGSGASGAATAWGTTLGLGAFTGAMAVGPLRRGLERFVFPEPGEGPSREEIESGGFKIELRGRGTDEAGDPFELRGTVAADRDPGYGATSTMFVESGLCLASSEADSVQTGGILTPASAMGMPLVERLREAGHTYEVERID